MFDIVEPSIEINEEQKELMIILFFILALLLVFLLGHYFLGINKEYEGIVNSQKEVLADKNKEITDSINYARRIQSAMLMPDDRMNEILPNSFVLYEPKDIVAGDFYWITKKGDTVLFAAADCTGHGVPGALVSVVCNNALNRSVREFGLINPAEILNKSRQLVVEEFEQNEGVKDGMDISLCALTQINGKVHLEWAGANNPLVIIRDSAEVIEVKADKQPVSKFHDYKPFTNHEISVKKGDVIYLFSDGFADQFGGEKGKKFKYKNLINILMKIADMNPSDQKKYLFETFNNWRGELEQLDDVCVIGVRI